MWNIDWGISDEVSPRGEINLFEHFHNSAIDEMIANEILAGIDSGQSIESC